MGIWDRLSRTLDELSEELVPNDTRATLEGARTLLDRGQAAAAAAALEQVLRARPGHATALHLLGVARLRTGESARAEAAFLEAIGHRAGFIEAKVGLGEARLLRGDGKAALVALRDALAGAGADGDLLAEIYRVMGQAHLALGDRERAVRELRKSLIEGPDAPGTVAVLAEALLAGSDADLADARAPLEKACARADAPPAALVALGRLELRGGRAAAAQGVLERAVEQTGIAAPLRAQALAALGECLLARGDAPSAHRRLLEALALAPSADVHLALARAHQAVGSLDAALAACGAAEELGAAGAAGFAVEVALGAGRGARAAEAANRLLAREPDHPLGLAARGLALAEAGEIVLAQATLERAVAAGETRHAPLALAQLALAAGRIDDAEGAAAACLTRRADDAGARAVWQAARLRQLGVGGERSAPPGSDCHGDDGDDGGFRQSLRRLVTLFRRTPDVEALAGDAVQALEAHDRPLVVTVMGEFSSGKSSFVNAVVGAEIAAVGITPTTATINVLKYGREPKARIVYRDDREESAAWASIGARLKQLTAGEAAQIRVVELLYPLDVLERVNVVDTPGLNSILPEHEQTARRFIAEADAVVWLFSAMQAGKASERAALEQIRGEGKRVLGVVNKIDQAGEAERAAIVAHLEAELGGLVEDFVPVSARRALAARTAGPGPERDEALAASGWPALEAALEARFFSQARSIKRAAAAARAQGLISAARARLERLSGAAAAHGDGLARAAAAVRADAVLWRRVTVPAEKRALDERLATAYRLAAREVLEVVRPRRLPFGSNTAAEADRDFLVGLLERALSALLEPSRKKVAAELGGSGGEAARAAAAWDPGSGRELERQLADALALTDARVFDRFRAYLRGYLRGGSVDDFFTRALPKLELEEDAVYHALVRSAPDLESELAEPLADAGETTLRAVAARLDELAARADLRRFELEDVLLVALEALARQAAAPAVSAASGPAAPARATPAGEGSR